MWPLAIPLIGAAMSGLGIASGMHQNKKNREFQIEQNQADRQYQWDMYYQQRRDSLEDFDATNRYNSPEEQMNRLRQAGLNPNLVYGKGADNTAAAVRSSQAGSGSQIAPKIDNSYVNNSLAQFQNFQHLVAQTDNVHQQTALSIKEGLLKDAQTAGTLQSTARSRFDLEQAERLKDIVVEQAIANAYKTGVETQIALDREEREKLIRADNHLIALEQILTARLQRAKTQAEIDQIREMIKNIKHDENLKNYLQQIRDAGGDIWNGLQEWFKQGTSTPKGF